jgi:hypothetical protein
MVSLSRIDQMIGQVEQANKSKEHSPNQPSVPERS